MNSMHNKFSSFYRNFYNRQQHQSEKQPTADILKLLSFVKSNSTIEDSSSADGTVILESNINNLFSDLQEVLGTHYSKMYLESDNSIAKVLLEILLRIRASMLTYVNEFTVAPDIASLTTPASIYKTLVRQNLVDEFASIKELKSVIRFQNYATILKQLNKVARLPLLYRTLQQIGILFDKITVIKPKSGSLLYKLQMTNIFLPSSLLDKQLRQQIEKIVSASHSTGYQAQFDLPLYILLFRDLRLELHLIAAAINYLVLHCPNELNVDKTYELLQITDSEARQYIKEFLFALNSWLSAHFIPNQLYPLLSDQWLAEDKTIHTLILQKLYPNLTLDDIATIRRLKLDTTLTEAEKRELYNKLSLYGKTIYRNKIEPIKDYKCYLAKEFLNIVCELNLYARDRLLANSLVSINNLYSQLNVEKLRQFSSRITRYCRFCKQTYNVYQLLQSSPTELNKVINDLDLYYTTFLKLVAKYVEALLSFDYLASYNQGNFIFPMAYEPIIELSKLLLPVNAELIVKAVQSDYFVIKLREHTKIIDYIRHRLSSRKISLHRVHIATEFIPSATDRLKVMHKFNNRRHVLPSDIYSLQATRLRLLHKYGIFRYSLTADLYLLQYRVNRIRQSVTYAKYIERPLQNMSERLRAVVYHKEAKDTQPVQGELMDYEKFIKLS